MTRAVDPYEPDATDRGRGDGDAFRGFLAALVIVAPLYILLAVLLWPAR